MQYGSMEMHTACTFLLETVVISLRHGCFIPNIWLYPMAPVILQNLAVREYRRCHRFAERFEHLRQKKILKKNQKGRTHLLPIIIMFGDFARARALRTMLVLDADNHFEGYTNSDGEVFDGGLVRESCLLHEALPTCVEQIFMRSAARRQCLATLSASLAHLHWEARALGRLISPLQHFVALASLLHRQGGFEIVDSYEGPGTWYSAEDGFGSQR